MEDYRIKTKTLEQASVLRTTLKASGKTLVFTNGCFDILHPGHTRYLHEARGLGDHLLVAVNSDRSVRAIKGPTRPVYPQEVRTELLSALGFVDTVIVFDEDTPLRVIERLVPDVLVKGGDWAEDDIVGSDVVTRGGGRVVRIPFVTGFSHTGLIERVRGLGD